MLDQLIESRSNYQSSKRRGGFMFTSGVLVFSLFASGITWSLFARDLDLGNGSLELSALVPPQEIPEVVPEPIREVQRETNTTKSVSNEIVRHDNIARTDEPIAPKDISTTRNTSLSRPNTNFRVDPDAAESNGPINGPRADSVRDGGKIGTSKVEPTTPEDTEKEPPVIKKADPPKVVKPAGPVRVSDLLNGKASYLPKPIYPAPAKAVHAVGDVKVQVTIDERGNVVSAVAVSGHPLLKKTSEDAARNAKFTATVLGGVPVSVTGLIVYKFNM